MSETTFDVIVNGLRTTVVCGDDLLLRDLVDRALSAAGNAGRPSPDEWEVRNEAGVRLSLDKPISYFAFPSEARVFVNLRAGTGA